MTCEICSVPTLDAFIRDLRTQGFGYHRIHAKANQRYGMGAIGRMAVREHLAHIDTVTPLESIAQAVDNGEEVGGSWFEDRGLTVPEGIKWVAATVTETMPGGEKSWIRIRPEEAEEDRVEIRQAQPVNVEGKAPGLTLVSKGNWQHWVASPDPQIGYWRDSDGRWHSIHDERCFSLGHQIAQAFAASDKLHGWLDVGDFLDLAAPSRHNPTTIDLHVDGLNKSLQRASDELARRRWLVGEEGEVIVLGGNHDCLDMETMAVTRRGPIHFNDLQPTDEVLTVDNDGFSQWVLPSARLRQHFEGELIRLTSQHYHSLMTPNHRVVGRSVNNGKWMERTALESGAPFLAVTGGKGVTAEAAMSDWDIRMAAWCHTDSYRGPKRWTFYQRDSKRERIEALLGNSASAKRRDRDITQICGTILKARPEVGWEYAVTDLNTNNHLDVLVPDKDSLAPWVWGLSERQVDLLVAEWQYTDGTSKRNGTSVILYCSREHLRRSLMTLMAANGYRVSETEYRPGHWRINSTKTLRSKVAPRKGSADIGTVPYSGDVWCLSVPFERFFVFRAGKIFLTGNCRLPKAASEKVPYLVGLKRPGDSEDEFPILSVPYLVRARDYKVEWLSAFPTGYRALNSNLVAFHAPAYGSKALDTARKIAAKVHVSVIHGHTHRREGLAENIETIAGARTLEIWSDGTWARTDGSLPASNSAYDDKMNRVIAGSLPENQGLLGPNMHQGMSIIHVEKGGRDRFSAERIAFWDGWAQFRGETFEATCSPDGLQMGLLEEDAA